MAKNNSWAKKIARFNSTKAQQNKRPVSKQQEPLEPKRKWPKFVLGFLIVGVLVTGIAIPLIVAAQRSKEDYPILTEKSKVFKFKDSDGKDSEITYGEIKNAVDGIQESKYTYSKVNDEMAFYLYEQEYKASAWYEAIYNANKVASEQKTFKLDSIEELKLKKQRVLDDVEQRIQTQFGYGKWEAQMKAELAKPEYGNSQTKEDAINHMVAREIYKSAYGRYLTEINTDFTVNEIQNGIIAEHDVNYTWFNSQTQKEERVDLFKKGDVIRFGNGPKDLHFIHTSGPYQNVYIPTDAESNKDPKKAKVYAFLTKSYINDLKDAGRYINEWMNDKPVITSQLKLNITEDASQANKTFKLPKSDLIKLLTFTDFKTTDKDSEIDLPINRIDKFSGVKNIISTAELTQEQKIQALNDNTLLKTLGSDNASTYGTQGFRSLQSIYSQEKPEFIVPYVSIIDNNSIYNPKEIPTFFSDLKAKIISEVFKGEADLIALLNKPATTWTEQEKNKAAENNKKIAAYINKMDSAEYDKILNKIISDLLTQGSTDNRINTVYKINDNYAILTSKGFIILNTTKITDESLARKLILSDLERKAKSTSSEQVKPAFNIESMFKSSIVDSNYVANQLLNDKGFIDYIKTKKYTTFKDNKETKFDDNTVEVAKKYSDIVKESKNLNLLSAKAKEINEYGQKLINNNLNADYELKGNTWIVKNHGPEEFSKFIFSVIAKELNGGIK